MTIRVKENAENVRITVQQLTDKPAEIAIEPPGISYRYLNIAAENITDVGIDIVLINFKVETSWITDEDVDPASIVLLRWTPAAGKWENLPTAAIGEDDFYRFYRAESPGLSIFVITGSTLALAPAEFKLSNLVIYPSEVGPGETVTISVIAMNVGEVEGTRTVRLRIDNIVEATRSVTLVGGEARTVAFAVSKNVERTYNVEVDGLTRSFTVTTPPVSSGLLWAIVIASPMVTVVVVALCRHVRTRRKSKGIPAEAAASDQSLEGIVSRPDQT